MARPFGSDVMALVVAAGLTVMAVFIVAAQEPSAPAPAPAPSQQTAPATPVEPATPASTSNPNARVYVYPLSPNVDEKLLKAYSYPLNTPQALALGQGPGTVCDITVIPLDPNIDRGIRKQGLMPKSDAQTKYPIRGVEGTCKPSVPVVPPDGLALSK